MWVIMEELIKILSVVGVSAVKQLLAGSPMAILLYEFSYEKAFICTAVGGFIGVTVFFFISEPVLKLWMKVEAKIFSKISRMRGQDFLREGSFIKKVIEKYGLIGLAILTPSVLSFPLGMFLAKRFFTGNAKILILMYLSSLIWAAIGASPSMFF